MNYLNITSRSYMLLLGIILILTGCKKSSNEPASEPENIPVGFALSLSGNFQPYGIIQQNGINQAIQEINDKALIPGYRIVPCFMDDKSVPDTCRIVFRDLIFNKKVLAIIGPTSSNSAFVADTVAQNNQVVVMGISNTVPGITEMGHYVFRNSLPESSVIPNTIAVTHQILGYSKVSIVFGNDDPYTLGAYDAFRTALEGTAGVTIITTDTARKGDTDFSEQVANIQQAGPDIIVLALLVNEAARFMVQARAAGIPETVRFIGGNSFNTLSLWQQAGIAAQGAICGSAWIHTENTSGNAAFVENYNQRYGARPDQFAAQAYTSVYILADAIRRAGTLNRTSLRNSLGNTANLETILGNFSFDANRNPVHTPVVQELVNGDFILFE